MPELFEQSACYLVGPLLSANPADAPTLLRLALAEGLAADALVRPTAPANG
ncbi:hypothetical protein ACFVHB_37355 [Kitasatospora sp. NPDC127111]|uniref:hypothetical protein n=1 Tax=Kitasatospora sp. NPDC127111 TaxID=3345363 RepID=UPI00364500D1